MCEIFLIYICSFKVDIVVFYEYEQGEMLEKNNKKKHEEENLVRNNSIFLVKIRL